MVVKGTRLITSVTIFSKSRMIQVEGVWLRYDLRLSGFVEDPNIATG